MTEQWVGIETNHRISKEASNSFWQLANKMFPKLYATRGDEGRKIPQIPHLRKRLYDEKVPPVKLEVGFECKESRETIIVKDATCIPVSKFPPNQYRRQYEIASVDVSMHDIFYLATLYFPYDSQYDMYLYLNS